MLFSPQAGHFGRDIMSLMATILSGIGLGDLARAWSAALVRCSRILSQSPEAPFQEEGVFCFDASFPQKLHFVL